MVEPAAEVVSYRVAPTNIDVIHGKEQNHSKGVVKSFCCLEQVLVLLRMSQQGKGRKQGEGK